MDESYIRKCLSLVAFALSKKGISSDAYLIGVAGDEGRVDQRTCLVRFGDEWHVFYIERGSIKDRARHDSVRDACNHFYWRLTDPENAWRYRAEWEIETGQKF